MDSIFALMRTKRLEEFQAGNYEKQYNYSSFLPNKICIQWILSNPELNELMGKADRFIGRLDAFSDFIPDIDFFIKMHITKEATTSSKIEGTQTNMEEAFISEEDINPEKRDDWLEVNNYIKAMNNAIDELGQLPLSNRLILNTHRILLNNSRGKEKQPGEFRKSQNWIGRSLKDAIFIPPHHSHISVLMSDLEQMMHCENQIQPLYNPHLFRIALIHYQFETIHPFLDGNGRIGRLLITLYLLEKEILKKPTLYLSDFFERNRRDYYDKLTEVRTHNDIIGWLKFFFRGVIETSQKSIESFENIVKLREDIEFNRLPTLGRKQVDAKALLQHLYKQPITSVKEVRELLKVHHSTANRLIENFVQLGILEEITGYKRNRIYSFREHLDLF